MKDAYYKLRHLIRKQRNNTLENTENALGRTLVVCKALRNLELNELELEGFFLDVEISLFKPTSPALFTGLTDRLYHLKTTGRREVACFHPAALGFNRKRRLPR